MNAQQQKEFLEATAWLRPFTRAAASFSLCTEGFLPGFIRNLPLKMVRSALARQQRKVEAAAGGSGGCGSH